MTLTHVYKLKTKEYRKLLDLTSDLAGAQLLEEEIDTRDLSVAQFTAPHIQVDLVDLSYKPDKRYNVDQIYIVYIYYFYYIYYIIYSYYNYYIYYIYY